MNSIVRIALLFMTAFFGGATTSRANDVRFIYLIPADRQEKAVYRDAVGAAARHFQAWLAGKTDGLTFHLADPALVTVRSDKPAAWFKSSERHSNASAFYRNAAEELLRLGVARTGHSAARYIVYVDADHACGQSGAGGNGLAIVSANDLRGLAGEAIVPACGQPNPAERPGPCRWVGGMGHELLHTLGLMHPDRLPSCQAAACRSHALMMYGYVAYPDASLLDEELAMLRQSPFISRKTLPPPSACRR